MKKLLLFTLILLITSCTNNIVGTWVETVTDSSLELGYNVGAVSTYSFNSDGTYKQDIIMQSKMGDSEETKHFVLSGRWEQPDENKIVTHIDKVDYEGKNGMAEMQKQDIEYLIVEFERDKLKLMSSGRELNLKRKK